MERNPKKLFKVNGAIYDARNERFFASFNKWNDAHLLPVVKAGDFSVLMNPSQSGKSTRIKEFLNDLKFSAEFIGVYIDMQRIIKAQPERKTIGTKSNEESEYAEEINYSDFTKRLLQVIIDQLPQNLSKIICDKPPDTLESFVSTKYCQTIPNSKKFVFFIDEIDRLCLLPKATRANFLNELRDIKHLESSYLQSVICITNWVGEYLNDTLGSSPFNIMNCIYAEYFNEEQTDDIWKQYEEQEKVIVPTSVKRLIFNFTNGAPGQFITLCEMYDEKLKADQSQGTYQSFRTFLEGNSFWEKIRGKPNFERILKQLSDEKTRNEIVNWMFNRNQMLEQGAKCMLQKRNIIRVKVNAVKDWIVDFATPLVKKFVTIALNQSENLRALNELFFTENDELDFVQILPDIIKNLNRYEILGGENKVDNYTERKGIIGKKEQVYRESFSAAMRYAFSPYAFQIHPEQNYEKDGSKNKKEIDQVCELGEEKFAIEHCANVSLGAREDNRHGLKNHIEKATTFMKNKGITAIVVHWTTANLKKLEANKEKLFPTEDVTIVHIHHTIDMRFTIITKEKTIRMDCTSFDEILQKAIVDSKKRSASASGIGPSPFESQSKLARTEENKTRTISVKKEGDKYFKPLDFEYGKSLDDLKEIVSQKLFIDKESYDFLQDKNGNLTLIEEVDEKHLPNEAFLVACKK